MWLVMHDPAAFWRQDLFSKNIEDEKQWLEKQNFKSTAEDVYT